MTNAENREREETSGVSLLDTRCFAVRDGVVLNEYEDENRALDDASLTVVGTKIVRLHDKALLHIRMRDGWKYVGREPRDEREDTSTKHVAISER